MCFSSYCIRCTCWRLSRWDGGDGLLWWILGRGVQNSFQNLPVSCCLLSYLRLCSSHSTFVLFEGFLPNASPLGCWEWSFRFLGPNSIVSAGAVGGIPQTNNKQFSGYKLGVLCMIQLNVDTIYLQIVSDSTDWGLSPIRLFPLLSPYFRYQSQAQVASDQLAIDQSFPQPPSWVQLIC